MNLTPFTDLGIAKSLLAGIKTYAQKTGPISIMEVCGTHTMEIGRLGLRSLLPPSINLLSGPGCPVCVTPAAIIDAATSLAIEQKAIILTFGDMIRVPGAAITLEQAGARGGQVEVLTSPLQCVNMARNNPEKLFVFMAVGFETTIPAVARAVQLAAENKLDNLKFMVAHRIVPPALLALVHDPDLTISGFLLPGHVSAIIGEQPYRFLQKRGVPSAITGFQPLDILSAIHAVCVMIAEKSPGLKNLYSRVVRPEGNPLAIELMEQVFRPVDALWRGIGTIPASGLALQSEFSEYDACQYFGITIGDEPMPEGCSCGDVLQGRIKPTQCPLFGTSCTPQSPVGPCMVSSEGSCAAYHRYGE